MQRVLVLGALLASAATSATLFGQPQAARASIGAIANVRDNLYVIKASNPTDRSKFTGGNTAVLVTNAGVVLVDTKLAGYGRDILEQVKSVTDKPVTTIINTHTHNDHSGSNTEFPASVEFIVHENTKANMARETCEPVTNCQAFKGANARYLPRRTFKDRLTLGSGRDQIDLYHFGQGHTNGDTWVVFTAARTMHTGDMFQRKNMPSIDVQNSGGSAVEFARTQARALAGIKNVDTIIPGHLNETMMWDDFREGVAFYQDYFSYVEKSLKDGKSAEQAAASWQVPDRFKHFQIDPARVGERGGHLPGALCEKCALGRGREGQEGRRGAPAAMRARGLRVRARASAFVRGGPGSPTRQPGWGGGGEAPPPVQKKRAP